MNEELKFFTDTHISKQVAIQLRNRGVDVVRCEEVGLAEADDEALLKYSVEQGRTMISMDSDFKRYYKTWVVEGKEHRGIFTISHELQGNSGIGRIVTELFDYWQLIKDGVGTLDEDIYNKIIWIK